MHTRKSPPHPRPGLSEGQGPEKTLQTPTFRLTPCPRLQVAEGQEEGFCPLLIISRVKLLLPLSPGFLVQHARPLSPREEAQNESLQCPPRPGVTRPHALLPRPVPLPICSVPLSLVQ